MNFRQLKEYVNSIPEEELNDFSLVHRKIEELDEEYWNAHDIPISAVGIDVENNILYFCNEESAKIIESQDDENYDENEKG